MTHTLTQRQQRAYERWQKQQERQAPAAQKWTKGLRNPRGTHILTATYAASLVIAVISMPLMFFFDNLIWVFLGTYTTSMIASMIAFTLLRMTIDSRDTAPLFVLDDYEIEVLSRWRNKALTLMSAALIVGGLGFALVVYPLAAYSPGKLNFEAELVAQTAGMYMIFVYLAVVSLPTVGYAATFNRNPEE